MKVLLLWSRSPLKPKANDQVLFKVHKLTYPSANWISKQYNSIDVLVFNLPELFLKNHYLLDARK